MFCSSVKIVNLFFLLFCVITFTIAEVKFSNVVCKTFDDKLVQIPVCRIKAIGRDLNEINIVWKLQEPLVEIKGNFAILKKANGYKPWLFNFTLDVCKFMRHRSHPLANMMYATVEKYTNLNHTCPYENELLLTNWRLDMHAVKLPVPEGSYLVQCYIFGNGKPVFLLQVYVIINIE